MSRESAFIDGLSALATHSAARGLQDDAAVLEVGGETLILTHDMMVENVHYLPDQDPADIAWKLVATNLSDLAAKGARPIGILLGHMLGDANTDADTDTSTDANIDADCDRRFLIGLKDALETFEIALLGGDTVSAPSSSVPPSANSSTASVNPQDASGSQPAQPPGMRSHGLTAIGRATHRPVPSRGGARPGDAIYVTGVLGAAMIGFEMLKAKRGQDAKQPSAQSGVRPDSAHVPPPVTSATSPPSISALTLPYLRPTPLIAEGIALAPHVSAMMDVSDGLLLDAARMATASKATFQIERSALPVVDPARLEECIRWGDDYQLLFTGPDSDAGPIQTALESLKIPVTRIGTVQSAQDAPLLLDGKPPSGKLGYSHN